MKEPTILTKHPKLRREISIAATASSIYIFTSSFRYHFNKFFPGLPVATAIKALYVVLFLLLVVFILSILKRRKKLKGKVKMQGIYYLPVSLILIGILYGISPVKFQSECLEGKVALKACYKEGATRAVIRLRANKKFEINWSVDGDGEIYYGTYEQKKDTILLTYDFKAPDKFGGVILNDGHNLICLDKPARADEYYVIFTIGLCEQFY